MQLSIIGENVINVSNLSLHVSFVTALIRVLDVFLITETIQSLFKTIFQISQHL